ncbi:MAG: PQQ-binding-like beta-propeller repeat protein [Acidobacteriota bacterium]
MNRPIWQNPSIKFLIFLTLTYGVFLSLQISAQQIPEKKSDAILSQPLPYKQCWFYKTKLSDNKIASDNESRLYIPVLFGKITSIKASSGEKLWETDLGGEIVSDLIVGEENKSIYVVTRSPIIDDGEKHPENITEEISVENGINNFNVIKLSSLSKNTGITNWQITLNSKSTANQKVFLSVVNNKIITADQKGEITAVEESGGEILWKKRTDLGSNNFRYFIQNNNLVQISENRIFLISLKNSSVTLVKEIKSILTAIYLFNNNTLLLGDKKGELFVFDISKKKEVWKSRYGAEVSNITFTPNGFLISSFDNFLYLISPKNGKKIWKKRLEGRLTIEPLIVNNTIIITSVGSSKASILDLSSGRLINQIYLSRDNYFVNQSVLNNNLIVFPTALGLVSFGNSEKNCFGG